MNNQIAVGSLSDVAQRQNISLAESFLSAKIVVLLDTSGSMNYGDAPNGKTRKEHAEKALTSIQGRYPGAVALITFASHVEFVPSGQPSWDGGTTDLTAGLEFVKVADDCGLKIVVVSDGEPDDERSALYVAKAFNDKIDVIYCGREGEDGERFLQRLAAESGGQFFNDGVGDVSGVETLLLQG